MLVVRLGSIKVKSLFLRGPQTNGKEFFPQKFSLAMEEVKNENKTGILFSLDLMWRPFPSDSI